MPAVEHAVIAAAGFGSRLGRGHPKCLVEVDGETILENQLGLLRDVPDVRIVVGFQEREVIAAARALRQDITFVRNPAYATTTTLTSYALGARHLAEPALFLDADVLLEPVTFRRFLAAARTRPALIGYTGARTRDPVYVDVHRDEVRGFSRTAPTPYEWANVAVLPPAFCEGGTGTVFEHLSRVLPLPARFVETDEIDCAEDLDAALRRRDLARSAWRRAQGELCEGPAQVTGRAHAAV